MFKIMKMESCGHTHLLTMKNTWCVAEPQEFWENGDEVRTSDPFTFKSRPETRFRIAVKPDGHCFGWFCLLCEGKFEDDEFECYLWTDVNGMIYGAKNRPTTTGRGFNFERNSCGVFQFNCRIVAKNCHFCNGDLTNEERLAKQLRKAEKLNNSLRTELSWRSDDHMEMREYMTDRLDDVTKENLMLKAKNRKLESFLQKIKEANIQVNSVLTQFEVDKFLDESQDVF
ncbi:hypothetical protein M3Y98_00083000 [Aphelenchoides besseyi]|nr:hypothetical protein M3Y98_00083000 [Aphelenchoides besseyi]KAI6198633.1 hypothetical protein M3Y96_00539900 [Aphelenchoides besseyi]